MNSRAEKKNTIPGGRGEGNPRESKRSGCGTDRETDVYLLWERRALSGDKKSQWMKAEPRRGMVG